MASAFPSHAALLIGACAVAGVIAGSAGAAPATSCRVIANPTPARHTVCRNADLRRVNLSGRDLRHADFTGSSMQRANLSRSNLSGARLPLANLTRANLTGVRAVGAAMAARPEPDPAPPIPS